MRCLPATADPSALDRATDYPADGPAAALTAARTREELDADRFRPAWIWLAEVEDAPLLRANIGQRENACRRSRPGT
ncbi:hypothetical protein [Actinacidiphila sp. bgisy160]|uniref:hypothetical protein n=1 Tax=Actinacidiphila sp. bgisy160 TaxID=3413796 RepID=UPI003D73C600